MAQDTASSSDSSAPAGTPTPSPPAASVPAPSAASSSTSPPAPAATRGRGQRGPDKRPRKRRPGSGSGSSSGKKAATSPLAVPLERDAKATQKAERGRLGPPDGAPTSSAPASSSSSRKKQLDDMVAMDSKDLAALAVGLGNSIIVKAAKKRYGEDIAKEIVSLDEDENEKIVKIGAKCLDKYMIRMEPEWALALTLLVIYGQKYLTAEAAHDAMKAHPGITAAQVKAAVDAQVAEQIAKASANAEDVGAGGDGSNVQTADA